MKNIIYTIALFTFFSCSHNRREMLGKYEYEGKHTIDSILIEENQYIHKIFNKDKELVYQGTSQWEFENNRIIFLNFYNNEDNILTGFLSEEQSKKFLLRLSCPIEINNKEVVIEANADENIIYLKKNN